MRRVLIVVMALVVIPGIGLWIVARGLLGSDLVRQAVEQQASAYLRQPVVIGSASASIFPRVTLTLGDVAIGRPPVVRAARIRLLVGTRALLSRRVEDAEAVVEDGRIAWPLPFPLVPEAPASPTASPAPLTIVSVRRIALRRVTVVTGLPDVTIDLAASLSGDRLEIGKLTAVSGATRLEAKGAFDSLARMEGRFDVKGDLAFAEYRASGLTATLAIANGGFSLAPLAFSMFGGRYQGRLDADLRRTVPQLQLAGDVSAADVAALLKNSGSPDAITGRLRARVALRATGSDGAALLHSANGTFTASIADGTLPRLDLVRAIVLAFGKPSGPAPAGSGSAFSALGGAFTLTGGTVATENLTLQSRDVDFGGPASFRIDAGLVSARGDAVLSRELTAQAGTDLRRYAQEDGRVIVPVTIGGTLDRPAIAVDVLAAARRAFGNEVRRRVGDYLGGLFKKKKGGG